MLWCMSSISINLIIFRFKFLLLWWLSAWSFCEWCTCTPRILSRPSKAASIVLLTWKGQKKGAEETKDLLKYYPARSQRCLSLKWDDTDTETWEPRGGFLLAAAPPHSAGLCSTIRKHFPAPTVTVTQQDCVPSHRNTTPAVRLERDTWLYPPNVSKNVVKFCCQVCVKS